MRSLTPAICLALAACGPAAMPAGPGATLGATPAKVTVAAPTSVLKLVTWDKDGDPGTGVAHFTSVHGALLEGPDIALAGGDATITFRCLAGTDADCQGTIEIDAEWGAVTSQTFVQATP